MRSVYIKEINSIEVQATEKEGKYYVVVNDKLAFDYEDKKFSQRFVPQSKVADLAKQVKEKKEAGEDEQIIGNWLKEKQKELEEDFVFDVRIENTQRKASEFVDELIKKTNPTYDIE